MLLSDVSLKMDNNNNNTMIVYTVARSFGSVTPVREKPDLFSFFFLVSLLFLYFLFCDINTSASVSKLFESKLARTGERFLFDFFL